MRAYRIRGHLLANLDPLRLQEREEHLELKPETYGFNKVDQNRKIFVDGILGLEFSNLNQIIKSAAIIAILSIITSIALIWIISRRTLNPITNIVNTSKYLSKGDFTKRIDQSVSGELSEIVTAFNYMASELQKLDEQRKIMIADIAHELRTPMTNLKGYIEGWSDGIIKPDNETLQIPCTGQRLYRD